jgi:hypothetical protein
MNFWFNIQYLLQHMSKHYEINSKAPLLIEGFPTIQEVPYGLGDLNMTNKQTNKTSKLPSIIDKCVYMTSIHRYYGLIQHLQHLENTIIMDQGSSSFIVHGLGNFSSLCIIKYSRKWLSSCLLFFIPFVTKFWAPWICAHLKLSFVFKFGCKVHHYQKTCS